MEQTSDRVGGVRQDKVRVFVVDSNVDLVDHQFTGQIGVFNHGPHVTHAHLVAVGDAVDPFHNELLQLFSHRAVPDHHGCFTIVVQSPQQVRRFLFRQFCRDHRCHDGVHRQTHHGIVGTGQFLASQTTPHATQGSRAQFRRMVGFLLHVFSLFACGHLLSFLPFLSFLSVLLFSLLLFPFLGGGLSRLSCLVGLFRQIVQPLVKLQQQGHNVQTHPLLQQQGLQPAVHGRPANGFQGVMNRFRGLHQGRAPHQLFHQCWKLDHLFPRGFKRREAGQTVQQMTGDLKVGVVAVGLVGDGQHRLNQQFAHAFHSFDPGQFTGIQGAAQTRQVRQMGGMDQNMRVVVEVVHFGQFQRLQQQGVPGVFVGGELDLETSKQQTLGFQQQIDRDRVGTSHTGGTSTA